MDVSALKRDRTQIHKTLVVTENDMLVTKTGCKIYIPTRYTDTKLATIGTEIRFVGIFAIVVGEYYGVSRMCCRPLFTPTSTLKVKIDGDEFYEFEFEAGAAIMPNVNTAREPTFVYSIYDDITAKGKIPWYLTGVDMAMLYTSAESHGNIKTVASNSAWELVCAQTCRQPQDPTKFWRHGHKRIEEMEESPPKIIGMRNIHHGVQGTVPRLLGSYFDNSVLGALTNPSEESSGIENLLIA